MANASRRRLHRWCAMALLECYECSPSGDLKSTVIAVLDEILVSKPVSHGPIDSQIPVDEPLAIRAYLETIVPSQIQTQLRKVVGANVDHPVPRLVSENVSVETTQTSCSSKPPAHIPPTHCTSSHDITSTSSPNISSSPNTRVQRHPVQSETFSTSTDSPIRCSAPPSSAVTLSKTRMNPLPPPPLISKEQEVAEEPSSKRCKTAPSQTKRKVTLTLPSQITRFPHLSRNIATEFMRKPKPPFEIELAQYIVREQASAPTCAHIDRYKASNGTDDAAVGLVSLREQITRCLSIQRLKESVTAFITAVKAPRYINDPNSLQTVLVQKWGQVLTMRDRRVVRDVRWRVRHVILGQEFTLRHRYR